MENILHTVFSGSCVYYELKTMHFATLYHNRKVKNTPENPKLIYMKTDFPYNHTSL